MYGAILVSTGFLIIVARIVGSTRCIYLCYPIPLDRNGGVTLHEARRGRRRTVDDWVTLQYHA